MIRRPPRSTPYHSFPTRRSSDLLPDTRFNLSVAGGFYEGANAIAANAGIRVSDKVAITAGIGGGLNKNGKVGGRVGIIFGW